MTVVLIFLSIALAVAGWWLSHQRLLSKPWLETGSVPVFDGIGQPPAKVGLGVFLFVVGGLFALLGSAYVMRMGYADWRPVPLPRLIWLSTAQLALSSVLLQMAVMAARRGDARAMRADLAVGGVAAGAFLASQALTWRVLVANGSVPAGNPADGFFYLLTAMHGLHVTGGIIALGFVGSRALRRDADAMRLPVELCAIYWHALLVIWIALLALFLGWPKQLAELCLSAFD